MAEYYNTPGVMSRNGILKIACLFANLVPNYIFYCLVLKINGEISRLLTVTVRENTRLLKLQLERHISFITPSAFLHPSPLMNIHSCANSCERYYDSPAKLCHRRCQNGYGRNDQEAANSIKKQMVEVDGAQSEG